MSAHSDDPDTLHHLFEKRVRKAPEGIALEYEGEFLSYGELNRRANRLAHHLRDSSGVRPDDRVAILLRHPPSVVVAMLAVLKAGGAYVPLDPENPPGVTRRILDNVAPRATVIESSTAAGAAFNSGDLFVTDVMSAGLGTPDTDPAPVATAADLAYVIYTSGTTGTPKGIAVEHHAIVNTIGWRNTHYGFGPDDVTLAIPRPSFDSSVADTFCALSSGARLLLPVRDLITDRGYLVELMQQRNVSHFLITPALYQRLLPAMDAQTAKALRSVTVAGEWFTSALIRAHFLRVPDTALFNEYGPSENAVCSTVHRLRATDDRVLIGTPITGTEACVLDPEGRPVAPGESGELYLAGAGLARGYLGDPELTARQFAVHRSGPLRGRRAYRTGDIVRLHPGGELEFLERRDQQVKIRGRRVELGSVAEVLARHELVRQVFLHRRDVDSATPRLVAFVVGPTAEQVDGLRGFALEHLPEYMVPTAIIAIDAVPVTGNGKVDEAALDARYADATAGHGPPPVAATATESALLEIWARIFAPLRVGPDDDFFDLGGDSLSVMDLVAQVDELLGVHLDNSEPYQGRTIRSLARIIENLQNSEAQIS
ncbi:amino acid adenylation domain-containing protein [Streptacidiphilus sp. P02-A3a]|uniref:amino acid adenylation domain-containing protein n=1 Tax=Streptacidiphilus sp. P02-A3a TaxID=2704468 RepID=UPI0015FB72A8|nr:amino acid adenylation domain-containing protein [Streptacidiphilus sp. P02-A3a]QMU70032.1 amino acid adenylation domain-containing protein [Streptacidiphilus sp. P02-A3a]